MEGDTGREPGRKGVGSGRTERAGTGILKVTGTGRKQGKFCNISLYFGIHMRQEERTATEKGREAGEKGTEGGRFRPPCPSAYVLDMMKEK